jgi:hypothetical protein
LHGGGAAALAGASCVGVPGVRVLRLQMLTQSAEHSPETLTLHVVKKKFRVFRIGAMSVTVLHTSELKPSQVGRQVTRHSSCRSANTGGGPMDSRTSAMHAGGNNGHLEHRRGSHGDQG